MNVTVAQTDTVTKQERTKLSFRWKMPTG